MHDDLTCCCDPRDAIHPDDGVNPAQPPILLGSHLGASPLDTATGTPPMIGRRLTIAEWDAYIDGYVFPWREPRMTVLHHTFRPDETTWAGLASMRGMQRFYAGKGWTSAPHIYCAPDGIWLFTPLDRIGIHAGRGNGSLAAEWYSVGVEMVGYFDRKLPSGPVWAHTLAVLRGLRRRVPTMGPLAFHRDYSDKTCPGTAVTKEWVEREMTKTTTTQPTAPAPTADYDEYSPLFRPVTVTADDLTAYTLSRNPKPIYAPYDVRVIYGHLIAVCRLTGIDPVFGAAKWIHETGNLSSWWCDRPRRNGAGIGVTGRREARPPANYLRTVNGQTLPTWAEHPDGGWAEGISFPSWEHFARAWAGRICLYTGKMDTPDRRMLAAYANQVRPLPSSAWGSVITLKALGHDHNPAGSGWAWPGTHYGASIAKIANAIARSVTR